MFALAVWAWVQAHPELCIAMFSAFVTWCAKPRTPEQYAAMNPRVAAFLKLWAALGPDLVKAFKVVRQLKSGVADPSKMPPKGDAR